MSNKPWVLNDGTSAFLLNDTTSKLLSNTLSGVAWDGTSVFTGGSTLAVDALIAAFKPGIYDETGATGNLNLASGYYTELEFGLGLDLNKVKAADVLTFRLYANGAPVTGYDQEIIVTIPAHAIAASTLFGGTTTLAIDATVSAPGVQVWQDSAVFAGSSSLALDAKRYLSATRVFAGSSSLALDTKRYLSAVVTFAGSSSLALDAKRYLSAVVTFAGSSSLALDTKRYLSAVVTFAGSSSLALDTKRYLSAVVTFAGSSSLALDATILGATIQWQGTSVFAGSTALKLNATIAPWIAGIYDETGATGNLNLDIGRYTEFEFGLALDPNVLKAGDVLTFRLYSNSAALDTYTQDYVVNVPAHNIAGAALLGASSSLALNATLGGAAQQASAVFAGSSSLALDAKHYLSAVVTFAGSSSLALNAKRYLSAVVTFAGSSSLALDATILGAVTQWQGISVFAGGSTLAADALIAAFKPGIYDETGATGNLDLGTGRYTEFEFGLALDPNVLKAGDILTFRLYSNSAALDTYTQDYVVNVPAHNIAGAALLGASSSLALNATLVTKWQATAVFAGESALVLALPTAEIFVPGIYDETGATGSFNLNSGKYTEFEFGLVLDLNKVKAGDTFDFRIYANGTQLTNYDQAVTFTVAAHAISASIAFAGASTLAANTKRYVTVTNILAGSSNLSATVALTQKAIATLPAASSLSAFATILGAVNVWPDSAVLAGTATLAYAAPTLRMSSGASLLPALGTLSADTNVIWRISTVFASVSTLAANVNRYITATASLAGASAFTANSNLYLPSNALLAGASALSAASWLRLLDQATLSGISSLTAFAQIAGAVTVWPDSALFVGTATLAYVTPILRVSSGALLLSGTGTLATDIDQIWRTNTAVFASAGTLSANTSCYVIATTKFVGASTLAADTDWIYQATTVLVGSSTLTANSSRYQTASTVFAGASTFAGDTKRYLTATSSFAGASTLAIDLFIKGMAQGTALLVGATSLSANALQRYLYQASTVLAGTSTLAAGSRHYMAAWANLGGGSTLTVAAIGNLVGLARLNATSSLTAGTRAKTLIYAAFAANVLVRTDAFSYGASEEFFTLHITSGLRCNALRPKKHWRRTVNLQGQIVFDKNLQGQVVLGKNLRGSIVTEKDLEAA